MVTKDIVIIKKPVDPVFSIDQWKHDDIYQLIINKSAKNELDLNKAINACQLCNLGFIKENHIPPTVNKNPRAIFIGRNPSKVETHFGDIYSPYSISGRVFDSYLEILELTRPEVYVTNVCHCYTYGNKGLSNLQITKCSFWKMVEFAQISIPKVIFLMGQDAIRLFFGLYHPSILSILGDLYLANWEGEERLFVPVLHPAHAVRDREWQTSITNILLAAKEFL